MYLPYQPDYSGKTVVITGGAGVLCGEFSKAFAACGAKVAVLDLTLPRAEEVVAEIKAAGGEAMAVAVDVLDSESVEAAHQLILKNFGKCDILINGAGGNSPMATTDDEFFSAEVMSDPEKKSFFDLTAPAFTKVFSLNIMGTLIPTQVFAKDMVENKKGCILNISSMNSYRPLTKIPAYSAAKSGVSNFTQWLSVYFAKTGVRCNAIAPGYFSTAQNAKLLWNEDGSPTARTGKILRATPMDRFGVPEDLLGAVFFLTDERCSAFVTGVVLPVDGGVSAYSGV